MISQIHILFLQDHPSQASPHVQNQFQSCPIAEWNVEHVRNWLIGIEMDKYIPLFTEKSVTGVQLVNLDTNRMKVSIFPAQLLTEKTLILLRDVTPSLLRCFPNKLST